MMTRSLAVQFAPEGIRTNAICPGPIETPLLMSWLLTDPEAKAKRLAGPEGIDRLLRENTVAVLIAPTEGPAWPIDLVTGDHFLPIGAGSLPAIAGYPHLTVPMGAVEGLPVGLSFIGGKWDDARVLELGAAYERARTAPLAVPSFKRWGE